MLLVVLATRHLDIGTQSLDLQHSQVTFPFWTQAALLIGGGEGGDPSDKNKRLHTKNPAGKEFIESLAMPTTFL